MTERVDKLESGSGTGFAQMNKAEEPATGEGELFYRINDLEGLDELTDAFPASRILGVLGYRSM